MKIMVMHSTFLLKPLLILRTLNIWYNTGRAYLSGIKDCIENLRKKHSITKYNTICISRSSSVYY